MASSALFYFENRIDAASFYSCTSEDADFPKENLQDRDQHSFYKPSNATDPQVLIFDLGTPQSARATLLVNENLYTKSVGLKLSIDAGDNPAFPSPTYLVGSSGSYHAPTSADQPLWYERFSAAPSKRYWRYEFQTGGDTDVLVADIYLSPEVDTERHPGGRWTRTKRDYGTKVTRGPGTLYATSSGMGPAAEMPLDFRAIPKTLWDALEAGHDVCKTGFLPFLYIDEYGGLNLARFKTDPSMDHHFGLLVNARVVLEQDY